MSKPKTIVAARLAGCLLIVTTGKAQTARVLTEHGSDGGVTSSAVTLNFFFSLQSAMQDSDGSFSFSWLTMTGNPYQVQYTTNLASSNWVDLCAALVASSGALLSRHSAVEAPYSTDYHHNSFN
jgi:hypothetical protein